MTTDIAALIHLGEGQTLEFKRSLSDIDKEIVAFANAVGGVLLIGVEDNGSIVGITSDNRTQSQIVDICRNCDPTINPKITVCVDNASNKNIIKIEIPEGSNKPYQCKGGFYVRIGPNSQKLKAEEIRHLFKTSTRLDHFEKEINEQFVFSEDFDKAEFGKFLKLADITLEKEKNSKDLLYSLGVGENSNAFKLNNAGILLFSKKPEKFIPECGITCVQYKGLDRLSVSDREEINGSIIQQIEGAMFFIKKNIKLGYELTKGLQREEIYSYPLVALREAVVNAITHRDYNYYHARIYISLFSDRLEIENPGGLLPGFEEKDLGRRSLRRNPIIADCMFRAKLAEKLGSGFERIRYSLKENGNPELKLETSNFFTLCFYPRVEKIVSGLNDRQKRILGYMHSREGAVTAKECSLALGVSQTTISRDFNILIGTGSVKSLGIGRGIRYDVNLG